MCCYSVCRLNFQFTSEKKLFKYIFHTLLYFCVLSTLETLLYYTVFVSSPVPWTFWLCNLFFFPLHLLWLSQTFLECEVYHQLSNDATSCPFLSPGVFNPSIFPDVVCSVFVLVVLEMEPTSLPVLQCLNSPVNFLFY